MGIRVKGARENNLKSVDVEFHDGLTVVTGVSGSGKTSLVFETLYHEARRRFEEVFQFGSVGQRLSPAQVERITGLGPAIAVGQNLFNRNPNSTLATASGLHPLLRLLFARFGTKVCSSCGEDINVLSDDEIVAEIVHLSKNSSVSVLTPLVWESFGSHNSLLRMLVNEFGEESLLVDGKSFSGERLDPGEPHSIILILGDLKKELPRKRVGEMVQKARALGSTLIMIKTKNDSLSFSIEQVCSRCGEWLTELQPKDFHSPMTEKAASVTWHGLNINELQELDVASAHKLFTKSPLRYQSERLHNELINRIESLYKVGLGYITLNRKSPTLSRGESQRVRLAVSLTNRLEDVLHILDEPTIGQHPHDVLRLIPAFRELKGPVIYVEHDRIAAALSDHAVDIGPGAGSEGGKIVFKGTTSELWEADTSTGRYFSLRERVDAGKKRGLPKEFIEIRGAIAHNLKNIDIMIPVGRLTTITGVSGSGKSTLIEDVLVESLRIGEPVGCRELVCSLKPVLVDQSPIGRNPRSTPATYTKLSEIIRNHYSMKTGYSPSHFSFNRSEGACPSCKGMGALEVKMRYLPSTWITCSDCGGRRYKDEVLEIRIDIGGRMLSIADFYDLSVEEAHNLLKRTSLAKNHRRKILKLLKALEDIGLGYLSLGQPSPTLSGGEAQRIKLAKFLGRGKLDKRLFVLDEPSTGLHPQDIIGLLKVLDNLVKQGATTLIVEHNTDIIRAADWVIDLGPGAGPMGGELIYMGSGKRISECLDSLTAIALLEEAKIKPKEKQETSTRFHDYIKVKGATANNLKNLDVKFPKAKVTVVTGVSGSGKSSLVTDILEGEARRRYLETLSMYERQGTREGPEAKVEEITGLGVTVTITPERRIYSRRNTVGAATEIDYHLAALISMMGTRSCPSCGTEMNRGNTWRCPSCGETASIAPSNRFNPNTYRAACPTCNGVGSLLRPNPAKLITAPEKPLCSGAMHSPGFFPKGYLCQPGNHGYDIVQAFASRHNFEPASTPWKDVPEEVRQMFYTGDPEPLEVTFRSRSGRINQRSINFPGFYGWVRDWDVGGTYTDTVPCSECEGARLRPEYLAVKLQGYNIHELNTMPINKLRDTVNNLKTPTGHPAESNLNIAQRRLEFLNKVGIGYLNLGRVAASLSAGEAQRVKLAGLLGSEITNLTILLDEPSRGLHPSEVNALFDVLGELRDEGNTVIIVEHDLEIIEKADHIIDMGPGPGILGGEIVAEGTIEEIKKANSITGRWLRYQEKISSRRRKPRGWMKIIGARENNLKGETVEIPLGVLVGVCGVSGSGKSTLIVDTLGRILDPVKHTTSVAKEPIDPGEYDYIINQPNKTQIIDQTRKGILSPAKFLRLDKKLVKLFAESPEARSLGLDVKKLGKRCSVCRGTGTIRVDMGFLPDIYTECETCKGTGYSPEAWDVRLHGYSLPEINQLTISEVFELFKDETSVAEPLKTAIEVGLGYLVLHQPRYSLSGGEAQRLRIAAELSKKKNKEILYILDEPTLGQHMEDVKRLGEVLQSLVDNGNSVLLVEHHPLLLAQCDWIIELGPLGGEEGGYVVASCPPRELLDTPTAPYIKKILENSH
jgi:excinuclease ABC subunit A